MELIESFGPGEFVLAKFLLGLFSFVGLVENIVVIVAILTSYILRDIPSNWFVLSLAIGDALFCVYGSVIFIHFQPTKHLPNIIRSVWFIEPLARVSYLSSSSSLFILIFNRFLSIYDSLKYPSRITLERAKRFIIIVWSVAIFMTILTDIWSPIDFLSFICFTLSSLSTIVLNIYLFNKASNQRKTIKRQHVTVITGQKRSMMSEYRSFFRLAMVTFTSGVAYAFTIGFGIFRYNGFARDSLLFQRMVVASSIVFTMNSAFNPLVYFITSHEFKRIFNKFKIPFFGRFNQDNLVQRRLNNFLFVIRHSRIGPAVNN